MAPSPQLLPRSRFAGDSPLEGDGFEPSVPRLGVSSVVAPTAPTGLKGSAAARRDRVRDCPRELADVRVGCGPRSYKLGARPAIVQRNLSVRGEPFHGARGRYGLGRLRFGTLLGEQLLGLLPGDFKHAPALRARIEHFQSSAAGVDLVILHRDLRFPTPPMVRARLD